MPRSASLAMLLVVVLAPVEAGAGPATGQDPAPRVSHSRKVDFELLNDTRLQRLRPQVFGAGFLPLRLKVSDIGNWPRDRRLGVMLIVYESLEPHSQGLGKLVKTHVVPEWLSTPAGETKDQIFEEAIPLPEGEYLFYVMLFDPDMPLGDLAKSRLKDFPGVEGFPGFPLDTKLCDGTVFPLEFAPYLPFP